MAWLAIHMWLQLLGAFLLGLIFGWWIWRCRHDADLQADQSEAAADNTDTRTQNFVSPSPELPKSSAGIKPMLFSEPTEGPADDLKKVKGIGPTIEKLLHSLGIFYYKQIAAWTDDEVTWVDDKLQFPGRIVREDWINQAKILRDGGRTEFANRYDKGETPSSYRGGQKKD